tara:strand:- start:1315 stop:2517 length:1203 start_codon:yes stop_codon:yes gene_type:complete
MIINFFHESWIFLNKFSIFLLIGFFLAGVLHVFVTDNFIKRNLSGNSILSIIKATVIGIPLPLCSCGVIPVAMSFYKKGSSKSSVTSFLISTPQTGVDSLMVTYSMLGPIFMLVRPVTSLFAGIFGGILVKLFDYEVNTQDIDCKHDRRSIKDIFSYGFIALPQDIAKPLLLGIILASTISIFLPESILTNNFSGGIFELCTVLLVSIPLYVCATASIPVAVALLAKGLSAGSALVFLMAGPVTNIATITTIYNLLGKRVAIIYLFSVTSIALLFGYFINIYNSEIVQIIPQDLLHNHHHDQSGILGTICSLFVLLILLNAIFNPFKSRVKGSELDTTIKVSGMTCNHCKKSVNDAVLAVKNIASVKIDLDSGQVFISGSGFNLEDVYSSIESSGFKIIK